MNLHEILSTAISYWSMHKDGLLALVGGGAGLSAFLEFILTKYKVDSKKLAQGLLVLLTGASSAAAYWLSSVNPSFAVTFPWLTFVAITAHRYLISGANKNYVTPFLQWLATRKPATPASQPQPSQASPSAPDQLV